MISYRSSNTKAVSLFFLFFFLCIVQFLLLIKFTMQAWLYNRVFAMHACVYVWLLENHIKPAGIALPPRMYDRLTVSLSLSLSLSFCLTVQFLYLQMATWTSVVALLLLRLLPVFAIVYVCVSCLLFMLCAPLHHYKDLVADAALCLNGA